MYTYIRCVFNDVHLYNVCTSIGPGGSLVPPRSTVLACSIARRGEVAVAVSASESDWEATGASQREEMASRIEEALTLVDEAPARLDSSHSTKARFVLLPAVCAER